jgi:signal transduction histidine kinase
LAFLNAEQSLEAQRRFVADASHELRTPLTTIRGNLGLLRRTPPIDPAEQDDVVGDIVTETERLMRLVNDLLVLARADAKRPLNRKPVAIRPLLEEVCQQAQILDPQRIITGDSEAATVTGDRDSLKPVLLALVDNALKYTPATAPIALTATSTDQQVTIRVSDTGPGIDPHLLPHIFDRFYRGDATRTEGGTGLGLSIAKELVVAQQGTLEVTSEMGHGTVFSLTFPAAS